MNKLGDTTHAGQSPRSACLSVLLIWFCERAHHMRAPVIQASTHPQGVLHPASRSKVSGCIMLSYSMLTGMGMVRITHATHLLRTLGPRDGNDWQYWPERPLAVERSCNAGSPIPFPPSPAKFSGLQACESHPWFNPGRAHWRKSSGSVSAVKNCRASCCLLAKCTKSACLPSRDLMSSQGPLNSQGASTSTI